MNTLKLTVQGMHCKSCKVLIKDIMEELDIPVVSLEVDEQAQQGTLVIKTDKPFAELKTAIESEGDYTVTEA